MPETLPIPEPAQPEAQSPWARLGGLMTRRCRSPWLDGLTPHLPVRVLLADGSETMWRQGEPPKHVPPTDSSTDGKDGLTAIEYPEDRLLLRRITLPDMSLAEVAQAAELDAVTASPFRSDDLAWGHRCTPLPSGQLLVDIVLASRKQVQQHLDRSADRLAGRSRPETWVEVWALPGGIHSKPVVIQGFGENRRARLQDRQRWLLTCLFLLAWGLLLGIVVTPTAQLRLQAIEAVHAYDRLHQDTSALVLKRESLSRANDQLAAVDEILAERVSALNVMGLLTRALPDDSSLSNLQIQGSKIRLTGQTSNSPDLMQKLSANPGVRDVKAPSAMTRSLGTNKESFLIELELTPAAMQVAAASRAASPAASANMSARRASSP